MEDLKKSLGQIFQGNIASIEICDTTPIDFWIGNGGVVSSPNGRRSYTLTFSFVHTKTSDIDGHQMLHALRDITDAGVIMSTRVDICSSDTTKHTIVIMISDLERFSDDIRDYQWKKYDKEMTRLIDGVLSTEDKN